MLIQTLLFVALFCGPRGPATDDFSSFVQRKGDSITIQFDTVGGTPLVDFVEFAQTIIAVPLDFDERDLSGIVLKTMGAKTVTTRTFWPYFQAVLRSRDIVVVPYGNVLSSDRPGSGPDTGFYALRKSAGGVSGAKPGYIKSQAPVVSPEELVSFQYQTGIVLTTSFTLEHLACQEAANMLQTYFTDPMLESVRAVSNSNTIVATGFAGTLYGIHELLQLIDVDRVPSTQELRRIVLKNAVAEEVKPIVLSMLGSIADFSGQQGQPRRAGPGLDMEPRPSVEADARTNALLVIASPQIQQQISTLVEQLDLEVKPAGKTTVISLENAVAAELADTLREWAESSGSGWISIVPDARLNALLITTSDEQLSQVLTLVKQLDVRQRQPRAEEAGGSQG
ncbi:MAG: secretin N-terminal domain-containing protein [Planctomycetota bacterium]